MNPSFRPPAGPEYAMAYDDSRNRAVLFGGGRTFEWDGSTWLEILPATTPPSLTGAVMAYDAARGAVVLFGGVWGGIAYGDTWGGKLNGCVKE